MERYTKRLSSGEAIIKLDSQYVYKGKKPPYWELIWLDECSAILKGKAVNALSDYEDEAERRENGCEYCKSKYEISGIIQTPISETESGIGTVCKTSDTLFFNFCPMCGKRLRGE